MKIFRIFIATLAIAILLIAAGCAQESEETLTGEDKPLVIATLFPQYDFTREIAGDKVEVILLLPPGVEPHSYEPSPRDIVDIQSADMFVYTGAYMEPWAERIVESAEGSSLLIVDTSVGINLMDEEDHHHDNHSCDGHDEDHHDHDGTGNHHSFNHNGGKDPHFWLDPLLAQVMVDHIVTGLLQVDPDNAGYYEDNGEAYKQRLQDLHHKIEDGLDDTENRTILYAGHFAFGYFATRYNLEHVSPYEGFAPDAEPTPGNIADLIESVEQSGSKVIYYEELIDPKVARVVAEQTGADMFLLHGAHNVTTEELASGANYISLMEDNLEKLLEGLR